MKLTPLNSEAEFSPIPFDPAPKIGPNFVEFWACRTTDDKCPDYTLFPSVIFSLHHAVGFKICELAIFLKCEDLLSLSKKSEQRICTILVLLEIKNLRAIEKFKMLSFRVFRQPRYSLKMR